jgi:predicted RNA-binding Zn-ribbon protein involved in translation (DUF1610 family)
MLTTINPAGKSHFNTNTSQTGGFPFMSAEEPVPEKTGKSFDSAYGFSFAIAIGLILFIAGLVVSLTLGQGTSIGLIFGIPLIIAGLAVPLFMMRDQFKQVEVTGDCPYCGNAIKTSDATIRLECPKCNGLVIVRDEKLYRADA